MRSEILAVVSDLTSVASEILTAALVIITAFYAWATYKILRANEKVVDVMHEQGEAISRPYISITPILWPDDPIFYLRISNIGKTAAFNLKFTLDRPFHRFGKESEDENLATLPVFNEVIDAFPPGTNMDFSLAQSFVIFNKEADRERVPTKFCVKVKYSFGKKTVEENNIIDLSSFFGAILPHDPYILKLKDIGKGIDKVADNLKKR